MSQQTDHDTPRHTVRSRLLGPVEVAEDAMFDFEAGLLGFPEARGFALLPAGRAGLYWLQSSEYEDLAFLLADPFEHVDGFAVELSEHHLRGLPARRREDLAVLAIVTLPTGPGNRATANLQGPVVLDFGARRGKQVVVQDSPWGVAHPVTPWGPAALAS